MYPNIVRQLDIALVKHAITLYQKKFDNISEHDWQLILQYNVFVEEFTKHLAIEFNEVEKLISSDEINNYTINKLQDIFYDEFKKSIHLYLTTHERDQRSVSQEHLSLENGLNKIQWSTVFSLEMRHKHYKDLSYLFWLHLFSHIEDKANISEIEIVFGKFLEDCIAKVFKNNPKDKDKLLDILHDTKNYEQIIKSLIAKKASYGFLSIYTNSIKLFNHKHSASPTLLGTILAEQSRYWHDLEQKENYTRFYFDAIRGTELEGKNIDFVPLQENAQAVLINDIISQLKNKNVSNNLIQYILNYVHQNGITQTGSNLFQLETSKRNASFSDFVKNVRIEVISSTKIRILSPVIYNSYFLFSGQMASEAPIKKNNPVYFELTSLILEDSNPNSENTSPSYIDVTIEDCFNELVEPDISEYWSHINIEFMIQKLINKTELESQERRLLTPYLTHTQRLQNLEDAPPAILIMLMLKDYNHAIEIMNNKILVNNILNSEYSIYIDKIYYKHKSIEKFIQASSQEGFWFNYQQLAPTFYTLLEISENLNNTSTNYANKIILNDRLNKIIANIMHTNNSNILFDMIRLFNNTTVLKLIKNINFVNLLTTEQALFLIKKNIDIAQAILCPQSFDLQLLVQHPASKLTQSQLLDIINYYPDIWAIPNSGFDLITNVSVLNKSQDKSLSHIISYRNNLSAETLVQCVYNENEKVREYAISAIKNDPNLIKRLFSSKKLAGDLDKLVRFYLEAPDSLRAQIKLIPEFRELVSSNQDSQIKAQLAKDAIKHTSITNLIDMLFKELQAKKASYENIKLYTDCILKQLENKSTKSAMLTQLEKLWRNTISEKEDHVVHSYLNKQFSKDLIQSSAVKSLLNNDAVLLNFIEDVMPNNDIPTYHFLLNLLQDILDHFIQLDNTNKISFLTNNKKINLLFQHLLHSENFIIYLTNLPDNDILNFYKYLNTYGIKLDNLLSMIARENKLEQKDVIIESTQHLVEALTPNLTILIFNRYIAKYNKNNLDANDYKTLFLYYVSNPLFRQKLNAQGLILKNLIENCGPMELTKLISLDRGMINKIITILTTNQQVRNTLLGNNLTNKDTNAEIKKFIITLLKSVLQSQGIKRFENFLQIIMIYQKNPQCDIASMILEDRFLKSQLTASVSQLRNKQFLSSAKQFLSMPDAEKNIFLKDKAQVANMIQSANRDELNLIFSLHSNILKEWQSLIMNPAHNIDIAICESILYQTTDMTDLTNIYLYTTKDNHDYIFNDKLLLNRMLSYTINLPALYIKDNHIRQQIENDANLINAMLSNKSKPDTLFNIYIIANMDIREKMLSNQLIFNSLVLMNNTSNLIKLIEAEPSLSSKLMSSLLDYYLKTEYMKWFVNRNTQLLNKLLESLNEDQFIVLLTKNPKKSVIETIVNNKYCYSLLLKLNLNQISSLNNYRNMISRFYANFPETPLPSHIRQILLENLKVPIGKIQTSTTPQLPSLNTVVDKDSVKLPANFSQGIKKSS